MMGGQIVNIISPEVDGCVRRVHRPQDIHR